jgi:hypothetical protein
MSRQQDREGAMDWTAETDLNFLKRVIALLLGLATLADRAASRPFAVRCRVLDILREGEAAAHAALCDFPNDRGVPALPRAAATATSLDGDNPSDAAQLALRLRALALVWASLLAWCQRIVHRRKHDGIDRLCSGLVRKRDMTGTLPVNAFARPAIDTS